MTLTRDAPLSLYDGGLRTADSPVRGIETRVLRTPAELDEIRDLWAGVPWARPDPDIDFFHAVIDGRPEVERPHVLLLSADGSLVGMAVARLETVPLECKIGYRTLYAPTVRSLTVVPGGVHGAEDPAVAAAVVDELLSALARREADMATLPGLLVGSPLDRAATTRPPRPFRPYARQVKPHWVAAVPDSFDDFLRARSRNTRENVKRYGKRLRGAFGDRLRIDVYGPDEDVDRFLADMEKVAAGTYQRGLGTGFAATLEQRQLIEVGVANGWFRAWILRIDEEPRAFWYGDAYRGTFFIGSPGYDPGLAEFRPGLFLQMRMMEDLCRDPAVSAIDYGFGDAQYKRSFGDVCREEGDVRIFAPSARGAWLNVAVSSSTGLDRLARRVVRRAGVTDRLKRAARRRGAGRSS
jgi:hypothetical protein